MEKFKAAADLVKIQVARPLPVIVVEISPSHNAIHIKRADANAGVKSGLPVRKVVQFYIAVSFITVEKLPRINFRCDVIIGARNRIAEIADKFNIDISAARTIARGEIKLAWHESESEPIIVGRLARVEASAARIIWSPKERPKS